MKVLRLTIVVFCLFILLASCKKSHTPAPVTMPTPAVEFAKGADVSWLTEMEATGKKFYNSAGNEQDLMLILKGIGMNTIRLRVWVNPTNGWNNKANVVAKAVRAKNAGMRVMIDFHYSDSWADPGKQTKPTAWASQDFNSLKASVTNHTADVLAAIKTAGVTPEWVQVGNEVNDGMLWPEGRASTNMANFAQLVNAGYDAVKAVFANAKVIVHVSNGWDNNLFRWLFDGLRSNGGKWDVIGMSLYPTTSNWSTLNTQSLANMNDMVSRYGKEVMIVETGMSWDQPTVANQFLTDIISKTKSVGNGKGLGVLYWEPEAYNTWQGYTLGAFDNSGKPTSALNAFNN
jgi:arabinogalactan endo-1,4-beta-galactosidase